MAAVDPAASHADLMDRTYRHQRFIYDLTRRHFLLGRDLMIGRLRPPAGARILEVGCGTGRNLALIARRYPECRLYGLDISEEMLRSARARPGQRAVLARGDACDFAADALFGIGAFDRIILSYSVSMIPDWRAAIMAAARHLAPAGELHIVDFGGQSGLPGWFGRGLRAFLARHHVTPRDSLAEALAEVGAETGCTAACRPVFRDYARYGVLTRT